MIELYHGDCLEILKTLPTGSVDMVLCDLPYGTTQNRWDVVIPLKAVMGTIPPSQARAAT